MRPLPPSEHELRAIARAHYGVWKAHKADIMAVFEAWRPVAESYLHARQTKSTTLKFSSARAHAAKAMARINDARPRQAELAASAHQLGILPHREPTPPVQRPPAPDNRPPRRVMVDRTRQ
jgi:hypothetical protein